MDCCGGLTSYPQQGTEGVRSTPEMRKLARIFKTVSVLDFKWKILGQIKNIGLKSYKTQGYFKYKTQFEAVVFFLFLQQGYIHQLLGFVLPPVQLAAFDEDSSLGYQ